MALPIDDYSRFCLHTMTTRPWSLRECIDGFVRAGVKGITVWRQALAPQGARESGHMLRDSGLTVVSLCRGGFFVADTAAGRQTAIDDNRRAIDEAQAIGAPLIVLVCGALPGIPLAEARRQIADGIAAVLPQAKAAGVKLAIEPLHPMYADARSAVNTLAQATDMAESLASDHVGVALDVYHVWWDDALEQQIGRCGALGKLLAFHLCDWRTPTRDMLNDRGLMGEGAIDLRTIRGWVEAAGFRGFHEVEIFSDAYWAGDQAEFVEKIKQAYLQFC